MGIFEDAMRGPKVPRVFGNGMPRDGLRGRNGLGGPKEEHRYCAFDLIFRVRGA